MAIEAQAQALEKAQKQLDELAVAETRCPNDKDGDRCGFYISKCDLCKGTGTLAAHEWARMSCILISPSYRPRIPSEVRLEDVLMAEHINVTYQEDGEWFASVDLKDATAFGDTPTLAAIAAAHAAWKEGQEAYEG